MVRHWKLCSTIMGERASQKKFWKALPEKMVAIGSRPSPILWFTNSDILFSISPHCSSFHKWKSGHTSNTPHMKDYCPSLPTLLDIAEGSFLLCMLYASFIYSAVICPLLIYKPGYYFELWYNIARQLCFSIWQYYITVQNKSQQLPCVKWQSVHDVVP